MLQMQMHQMMAHHSADSASGEETKVSVCIPTYNAAKTIKKVLGSILNQTVKPFEILVVDGYSQDETLKVLEEYPNVKIIGFARGIGKARKILANNAIGDLTAWVDADVIVPQNWIEQNVQIHLKRKDVMILSGEGGNIDAISPEKIVQEASGESTSVMEWLGITQAACTMKKELFSVVNYDERFKRSEDWDFFVSAHRKGIKTHRCRGLKYFHIGRSARVYLKDMMYAGTYVLFFKKHGLWYVKFNPKHFLAFVLRIGLIYAVPLTFLFPSFFFPFALVIFPVAWVSYAINGKIPLFSKRTALKLLAEMVKGIGEHLYLFKLI